jgi:hypothetical protein
MKQRGKNSFGLVSIAFALAFGSGRAVAQSSDSQPSITMDLSPAKGTVDDVFELTVRISLSGDDVLQHYEAPELDEFQVLERSSDHTKTSTSTGADAPKQRFSSYRYSLTPRRNGLLRIERARMRVNGRTYETSARVVEVVSALDVDALDNPSAARSHSPDISPGRSPMEASSGRQPFTPPPLPTDRPPPEIFVHASTDRDVAYVGQQVTVTWVLYTRHELIEFEPEVPRLDDFWTEILYEPATFVRQGEIFLSGIRYQVVVVSKRALFPLRPGRLSIEPYRARASALYTPLGDHMIVHSQGIEIHALPLPEGAPASFDDSYVGLFKVSASVDRTTIPLGEPLLLGVTVRGHGAIRRTTPPPLKVEGFEVQRVPDFRESVHSTDRTAIGMREYRYWLTPKQAGILTIPAIRIPYFDPRTGTYESALSQALTVAITDDVRRATVHSDTDDSFLQPASARDPRSALRWWFPAGLAGLAAVFFGLAWRLRARSHLAQEGRKARRLRFQQAERYLEDSRWSEFFGELAALMERALQVHLNTPVRSLTRERLLAMLDEHGLHRHVIERIGEQLELCDMARFASSEGNLAEMRDALQRVRELLRDISDSRSSRPR